MSDINNQIIYFSRGKKLLEVFQHMDGDIEFEVDDDENVSRFYLQRKDLPRLIKYLTDAQEKINDQQT